jgi:3-isopropylmalate dehydrogenase
MHARIALLEGDGIGPEVIRAAEQTLQAVADVFGHQFSFDRYRVGGAALRAVGVPLPKETRLACLESSGVLLGAVGDPAFDTEPPETRPERALLDLRRELGVFANLRPARVWPGVEASSPLRRELLDGVDLLIVRELTGGLYYGEPRGRFPGAAVNTLRYTESEIVRVAETAFRQARARRKHVTSVDKANVLEVSQLWRSVVSDIGAAYPDVRLDHMYVDNCAMQIALRPSQFDVILTENLFGDILSDEAGAVAGSLGLLPSASLGSGPGIFEPVHGSAPALAGRDVANPVGAIVSAAMLLRYGLGAEAEARSIERAVEQTLARGIRTADVGGSASCSEVASAIARTARAGAPAGRLTPP